MLISASAPIVALAGFDEAWRSTQQGNYKAAFDHCIKPAEDGDGDCMSLIGHLQEYGEAGLSKDLTKAAEWQRAGAEKNSRRAQYYYGLALLRGDGIPKNINQGVELIAKSSAQGYPHAHVLLADLYLDGEILERDNQKAFELAKAAADLGFAPGHTMLGYLFHRGKGASMDLAQAAVHYRTAAEQGDEYALNSLGLLYARGEGVPMDRVIAYALFHLSAGKGLEDAAFNRAKAESILTRIQIDEATALSANWKVGEPLPYKSKTWVEPKWPHKRIPIREPRRHWLAYTSLVPGMHE